MSAFNIAFKRFLNSETGPRTVHFWAPTLKWGLVIAGISDMNRPVNKLSATQSLSLLATGLVWARWSFVITPKNYLLASVNIFLACTAGYQVSRIVNYRLENGDTLQQVFKYMFTSQESVKSKPSMAIQSVNQENLTH